MNRKRQQRPNRLLLPAQPWRQRCLAAAEHHISSALGSLKALLVRPLAALLTLLVLTATLILPTGLHLLMNNLQQLTNIWQNSLELALFLTPEQSESQLQPLRERLAAHQAVTGTEYVSAEQALTEFRQQRGMDQALALLEHNPLPAVLRVHLNPALSQTELIQQLVHELESYPGVELVKVDLAWFERAQALQKLGQRLVSGTLGFFALVLLLIVGNTVKLSIEQHKDEIEVIRLVGGTHAYIRRPFLYSGLWLGLFSGLGTWLGLWLLVELLRPAVVAVANSYSSSFELVLLSWPEVVVLIALSSLLSVAGAWLTVGRHLYAIDIKED